MQMPMQMQMQVQVTAPTVNGAEQPTMLLQVPMMLQAPSAAHPTLGISMMAHPQAPDGTAAASGAPGPQAAVQALQLQPQAWLTIPPLHAVDIGVTGSLALFTAAHYLCVHVHACMMCLCCAVLCVL
jgi:hypothetical protein